MDNKIVYGIGQKNKKQTFETGGLLTQLHGMQHLEAGGVTRLPIRDLEKLVELNCPSHRPLEVRRGGQETAHLLDRAWVGTGLVLYDNLVELVGGEEKVFETYVLPFTGTLTYLLLLGDEGEFLPVPQEVKEQPLLQSKVLEGGGSWVAVYLSHAKAEGVKSGGVRVTDRLLARVGCRGVAVSMDLELMEEQENEEEEEQWQNGQWWTRVDGEKLKESLSNKFRGAGWGAMKEKR